MKCHVVKDDNGKDGALWLAGDVWETSEPVPMPFFRMSKETVGLLDIRASRIPEWNEYYILPLHIPYIVLNDKDIEHLEEQEGKGMGDGILPPAVVNVMKGVVGVHRTGKHLIHTKEVILDRFLLGVELYDWDLGYAIIVEDPLEMTKLVDAGYKNVLATMISPPSIAQEFTLMMRGIPKGAVLVNGAAKGDTFRPAPGKCAMVERVTMSIDPGKVALDRGSLDIIIDRMVKGVEPDGENG